MRFSEDAMGESPKIRRDRVKKPFFPIRDGSPMPSNLFHAINLIEDPAICKMGGLSLVPGAKNLINFE